MRLLARILFFLVLAFPSFGQTVGGAGWCKTSVNPNTITSLRVVNQRNMCSNVWDTLARKMYYYDYALTVGSRWVEFVPLGPPIGAETKVEAGTGIGVSGNGTIATPYIITNTGDLSNTNEIQRLDTFTIVSGVLRASLLNDGVPFSSVTLPTADGSETQINAGTAIGITGTGTTGSPYVVTNTADLSVTAGGTNALQIALNTSGQTPIFVKGMGQVTVTESATGDTVKIGGVGGIYGVSDTTQPAHVLTIAANSTLTFQSQGDNFGGVVPFRVKSDGNEPDIQGWYANGDSLTLSRSDTEFVLSTPSGLTVASGANLSLSGDSVTIATVGAALSTEKTYLQITPGNVVKYTEGIPLAHLNQSGAATGQVVKWNGTAWVADADGGGAASVATVADSTAFRAFSATADVVIMTDKDRGGKFRKCTSCTADQYMVFTDATAQKWERYDYGENVFPEWFGATTSNNATGGWKRVLRFAQGNAVKVMMRGCYTISDSVLLQKKVHIEGLNVRNQSSTTSCLSFNIPGNLPAIYFIPFSQSTQGPIIRNLHVQDESASGSRHFLEFYAEIADAKFVGNTSIENVNCVGFDRYFVYANDCYLNTLILRNINITSCGGLIGVDMSGTKLVTQSQGDSWTLEDITSGGNLPQVFGGDTAMIDVRDVGNVVIRNVVLQFGISTTSRELIWADYGPVTIEQFYVETQNDSTAFGNLGRFGNADNSNCRVTLSGMECSMGNQLINKRFRCYGWTDIMCNNLAFGETRGADIFQKMANSSVTVEYRNYMTLDRLQRVDKYGYATRVGLNAIQNKFSAVYPSGGEIFKLGKDSLFGAINIGTLEGLLGNVTQTIDATKGKVFQVRSTGSRAVFVMNITALPDYLKGRKIWVSMTYKFTVSDSTTSSARWALYNPFSSEYISTALLQLNRWCVATDVFTWPVGTGSAQLSFGDTQDAFPTANATFLIKDITIGWGDQLKPEEMGNSATEKRLVFRENISGANLSGFLDGDMVSTEQGVYLKKSGAWVLLDDDIAGEVTGAGAEGQIAFWAGADTISGENNLWWDKNNNRLGVNTSTPGYAAEIVGSTVFGTYGLVTPDFGEMTIGHKGLSPFIEKFAFTQNSSGNTVFNGLDLFFRTGNVTRAYMTSGGNFGINEPTPSERLHVSGNARITGAIYDSNNDPGSSAQVLSSTVTGTDWVTMDTNPSDDITGSGTANYVPKFTSAQVLGNSLLFDNGTNVGIGTASPSQKLHVNGNAILGYALLSQDLFFGEMTMGNKDLSSFLTNYAFTQNNSGNTVFNGADLYFRTGNTTRAYMASGGNFGINETSPSERLHVSGNARITGAIYDSNNDPGSSAQVLSSTVTGTDWVTVDTNPSDDITGSGAANQFAYFDGTQTITSGSGFTKSGNNMVIGPSGGDHVEIIPGTSEISLFNVGTIDARIFANDLQKIETNVGLAVVGNSAITGNLDVSGSITTSSHFRAPGISSGPSGLAATASGTLQAWSPTGTSPYVTFSENGIANRGAFGFPASSGDFVWSVGDQVLSSGTERMRLTSGGNLGIGVSPSERLHVSGNIRADGTIKTRGTGTAPTVYLDNTTASTGKEWYINSGDAGSLFIGNPTTADAITINGTTGATTIANTLTVSTATGTATTITGRTSAGVITEVPLSGLTLTGGTLTATGGGTNYQTFKDDGVSLTQRPNADFISTATVTTALVDNGSNATEVSFNVPTDGITATQIAANAVGASELSSLGTAGTYGSATQVPVFTTDADGRVSAVTNTAITGLLSGLTATRIPFASGAAALTDDNRLRWDNTNKRLSVGDTGGSPAASVHIAEGSVTSWEPLKAVGTVSGNMIATLGNANNAGGNNLVDLSVGGASAGDPAYRWLISGVDTWSMGIDNSDADKWKLKKATTPSTLSNVGITMTADATPLIGINNDAPLHPLHVIGRATATLHQAISGSASHTFGAGAGTSPTLGTLTGTSNGLDLQFTTGTTPSANANVISITLPTAFSNTMFPVFCAANAQTATDISKFYISVVSASAFTLTANGTLSASTTYRLKFNISGR